MQGCSLRWKLRKFRSNSRILLFLGSCRQELRNKTYNKKKTLFDLLAGQVIHVHPLVIGKTILVLFRQNGTNKEQKLHYLHVQPLDFSITFNLKVNSKTLNLHLPRSCLSAMLSDITTFFTFFLQLPSRLVITVKNTFKPIQFPRESKQ